jgi:hypothetical protein
MGARPLDTGQMRPSLPPLGGERDPAALRDSLHGYEQSAPRFCFLREQLRGPPGRRCSGTRRRTRRSFKLRVWQPRPAPMQCLCTAAPRGCSASRAGATRAPPTWSALALLSAARRRHGTAGARQLAASPDRGAMSGRRGAAQAPQALAAAAARTRDDRVPHAAAEGWARRRPRAPAVRGRDAARPPAGTGGRAQRGARGTARYARATATGYP